MSCNDFRNLLFQWLQLAGKLKANTLKWQFKVQFQCQISFEVMSNEIFMLWSFHIFEFLHFGVSLELLE